MGVTTVRTPAEFEERLARYLYERSEEGRAVRVGEKETSEQGEIVRRYADLFSREQLEAAGRRSVAVAWRSPATSSRPCAPGPMPAYS